MELSNYSKVKIKDICTWERSKKRQSIPCWVLVRAGISYKGTNGICGRATGSRV